MLNGNAVLKMLFMYLGRYLGKTAKDFTYIKEAYLQQQQTDGTNCGPIVLCAFWEALTGMPLLPCIRKGDVYQPAYRTVLLGFFQASFHILHDSDKLLNSMIRDRMITEENRLWSLDDALAACAEDSELRRSGSPANDANTSAVPPSEMETFEGLHPSPVLAPKMPPAQGGDPESCPHQPEQGSVRDGDVASETVHPPSDEGRPPSLCDASGDEAQITL